MLGKVSFRNNINEFEIFFNQRVDAEKFKNEFNAKMIFYSCQDGIIGDISPRDGRKLLNYSNDLVDFYVEKCRPVEDIDDSEIDSSDDYDSLEEYGENEHYTKIHNRNLI